MIGIDEAKARIAAALAKEPWAVSLEGFRRAGVLVPILSRPGGPTVLFTMRTDTVKDHPGQISFPGGRFEAGEDARAAALREAHEEVGLEPSRVGVVGAMDDQISVSNYIVTPVVGIVADPPASFIAQAREVVEPFELPLEMLLDRSNFREERWDVGRMPPGSPIEAILKQRTALSEYDQKTQTYPVYFFDGGPKREVWGLTARILKDLLDVAFGFSAG